MSDLVYLQLVNGVLVGSIYALVAAGLTMTFGVLRAINFAHGEYYMLGTFAAWICMHYLGLSYAISVPVALMMCLVVGWIASRTVMERLVTAPFQTAVLATLGVYLVLQNTVRLAFGGNFREFPGGWLESVSLLGISLNVQRLVILLFTLAAFVGLQLIVRYTRIGKMMRAVAQNKEACAVVGIDVEKVTRFTFTMGIALAALSGVLTGPIVVNIDPSMGEGITFKAFAIIVMGGMGNVAGTALAALMLGIVESFVAGFVSLQMRDAVGFIALNLVLLLRPQGLFAVKERF